MRNTIFKVVLFAILNFVLVFVHIWLFRNLHPYSWTVSVFLHGTAILYFPYQKLK